MAQADFTLVLWALRCDHGGGHQQEANDQSGGRPQPGSTPSLGAPTPSPRSGRSLQT
ncbi:hypothetical protein KBY66_07085 [Synechococcus sp. Tobar12-5m-g]|uniref:hypothetical protein n=1 Tax=Synechococcus sp. Tobar12-5m-g TaxID=2823742 RepID=UPI0020CFDBEA|nr:hypothetical protein [Synechococcus sp. Tobar12-5m-g]MCP9772389.1 hypothetical protein [Synechococcus sp. Tobar12-5m-g]